MPAAGCRLAIASASATTGVHALLRSALGKRAGAIQRHRLRRPGASKEARAGRLRLVLDRLGLRHDQVVAFEDSTNGLLAADAAGLWTVVTPTMWTAAGHFDLAGVLLPRLGDPWRPLRGEPGASLHERSWLTFDELAMRMSSTAR